MSTSFLIGGMGTGVHEVDLEQCEQDSVFQSRRTEIAEALGIDAEFAKFVDNYNHDRMFNDGPEYYPAAREKCAIAIINYLGLPDVFGKREFMDLRDNVTQGLIRRELSRSSRDTNHAVNLFDIRMKDFYRHAIVVLDVEERERLDQELEAYADELREKALITHKTLGAFALQTA